MDNSHLHFWKDKRTRLMMGARVTLPFRQFRIMAIDDIGISITDNDNADYWLPFSAIVLIRPATEADDKRE